MEVILMIGIQFNCHKCEKCGHVYNIQCAKDVKLMDKIKYYTIWRTWVHEWTCLSCGQKNYNKAYSQLIRVR